MAGRNQTNTAHRGRIPRHFLTLKSQTCASSTHTPVRVMESSRLFTKLSASGLSTWGKSTSGVPAATNRSLSGFRNG